MFKKNPKRIYSLVRIPNNIGLEYVFYQKANDETLALIKVQLIPRWIFCDTGVVESQKSDGTEKPGQGTKQSNPSKIIDSPWQRRLCPPILDQHIKGHLLAIAYLCLQQLSHCFGMGAHISTFTKRAIFPLLSCSLNVDNILFAQCR